MPTTKSLRSAFATEALTLRAVHAYRTARTKAERYGVDLSADPVPPSFEAMSDRYDKLLSEWDCSEVAAALEEKIEAIRPATILGALKMLERGLCLGRDLDPPDSHSMIQQALAGLRDIAAREDQP